MPRINEIQNINFLDSAKCGAFDEVQLPVWVVEDWWLAAEVDTQPSRGSFGNFRLLEPVDMNAARHFGINDVLEALRSELGMGEEAECYNSMAGTSSYFAV